MKPPTFEFVRVHDIAEAIEQLRSHGEEAKLLAGGQSLVPLLSFRLVAPAALIDIARIDGLRYARVEAGELRVGALTTHRALERSDLGPDFRVLARAASHIGHYPIRTRGTIGGSLAHADPAAEWPLVALALDARIVARGAGGERVMAADGFFRDYLTTALAPDEMITEVRFPVVAPCAAIAEHARRHGDFALAAACVRLDIDGGVCRGARVAVGGVGPVPARLEAAEALLAGSSCGDEVIDAAARAAMAAVEPPDDVHATAEHRRRLLGALVRRACREAVGRTSDVRGDRAAA